MGKNIKIKTNSNEKLEELIQETYDITCQTLTQIENEISKLSNSTKLSDISLDEKAKYSKSMHDYLTDKDKVITRKHEIAKLLFEVVRFNGDGNKALKETDATSFKSIDINALKKTILEEDKKENKIQTFELRNHK